MHFILGAIVLKESSMFRKDLLLKCVRATHKTPSITPLYSKHGFTGALLYFTYFCPKTCTVCTRYNRLIEATLRIPIHVLCVLEAVFTNTHTCTVCTRGGLYEYPYMYCVYSRQSLRIPIHVLCVLEAVFTNTHTCTVCTRGGLYEYPYMYIIL